MVVDDDLISLTRESLGATPKRILVTGATGFVGSRLAQVLVEAGHEVTITGRSKYRVRSEGTFVAADIASAEEVAALCKNQQIVFHSAALTSPWGSLELHRSINRVGTKNVVDACIASKVERLVHVSTTAIFFQFRDRDRVTDETEFPNRFCCPYAQSKAEAEQIVTTAIENGLNAYIVRARAVFGPGDNALLPRLINAAESGRLRQIGSGENLCDLTYIDNLVAGLILAAKPDRPSGTCTITNEEPVKLWDVLKEVLKETTGSAPNKKVPYWLALRVAHLSEIKHRLFNLPGEPAITRYGVGLLAKQQTFVSQSANTDLGYRPIIKLRDGIERTIRSLGERNEEHTPGAPTVEVSFYSTGYVEFKRNLAERGAGNAVTRFHATVALIKHPTQGLTLFDAGYSPEFFEATKRIPYKLYRWTTKVVTDQQWTIENWLERGGIALNDIDRIVVSHFHADHIGSLKAFPDAEIVASKLAWDSAKNRRGVGAVRRGILPGLMPADLQKRIHTLDQFHSPGFGRLPNSHDLFRDGSVRLFDLDGHSNGQLGMLLQVDGGRQIFLVADTFWSRCEIDANRKPTFAYRMIADNYKASLKSRELIHSISESHPNVELVCTHCPEFTDAQGFDELLAKVVTQS